MQTNSMYSGDQLLQKQMSRESEKLPETLAPPQRERQRLFTIQYYVARFSIQWISKLFPTILMQTT